MRKILGLLTSDRTIKANAVMVTGNFIANVGAYLFYLTMGRLMHPSDYGALQSLISLVGIFMVPLVTLNFVVAKFVSSYVGKGEENKISALYAMFNKIGLALFAIGGIFFLLLTPILLEFLHLTSWVNIVLLDFGLFFGFFVMLNKATLQGLSRFLELTISQFIESYGKLILGIVGVVIGFGVPGAFGAFVLVSIFSFGYMAIILRPYVRKKERTIKLSIRPFLSYAIPTFLATIGVVSFYNTDVVLVRHFFDEYQSGLYAGLSVLGKIIFFATAPVGVAMFPLVSEAHARGESFRRIFFISLITITGIAAGISFIYALFPSLALRLLLGHQYVAVAALLPWFGLFVSLCALVNLFAYFFLSIHKMFPVYATAIAAVAQALLIWFFHGSLSQVITMSLLTLSSLVTIQFLYYVHTARA